MNQYLLTLHYELDFAKFVQKNKMNMSILDIILAAISLFYLLFQIQMISQWKYFQKNMMNLSNFSSDAYFTKKFFFVKCI